VVGKKAGAVNGKAVGDQLGKRFRMQWTPQPIHATDEYDWLILRIVYYPPYHSKYKGIERYRAGLEKIME